MINCNLLVYVRDFIDIVVGGGALFYRPVHLPILSGGKEMRAKLGMKLWRLRVGEWES